MIVKISISKMKLSLFVLEPAVSSHSNFQVRGEDYTLELIDTAGQDEYSAFPSQYSIGIHGYILVYSITSDRSFHVVRDLYYKLLDTIGKVK